MAIQNTKTNLKEKRRGGFYWRDKVPYISVTNVTSILDKPQLRYWFGKQVYYAFAADPTLNEKEALSKPYTQVRSAAARGTTIHTLVEMYKHTKEYVKTVPKPFQGFIEAFYKWIEDNDIEIMTHERTVFSEKHKFAGTLDLLVKNKTSNRTFVVDVKTGGALYPEFELQTSAYKGALEEEGIKVDSIAGLLLTEKGKPDFKEGEDSFDIFLHCLEIWKWKNKDIIKAIGG